MVRPPNPLQGHESFQYPSPGPSSVLEYQASGLPYVTQSTATTAASKVELPFVSKFFTVKNNGAGVLQVGFTENGVLGSNKFSIPSGSSFTGDIRTADLFFASDTGTVTYELIAGLTQIPRRNWFILTGALNGFSGSVGANQITYGNKGFGYDGLG